MSQDLVENIVRIPAPVNKTVRSKILLENVKLKNKVAEEIIADLAPEAKPLTLVQGTADWFVSRRTGMTASVASSMVKNAIKFRSPDISKSDYPAMCGTLWTNYVEDVTQDPAFTHETVAVPVFDPFANLGTERLPQPVLTSPSSTSQGQQTVVTTLLSQHRRKMLTRLQWK